MMLQELNHSLQAKFLALVGSLRYLLLERYFHRTMRLGPVIVTLLLTLISTVLIVKRGGVISFGVVAAAVGVLGFVLVYDRLQEATFALMVVSTVVNVPLPYDLTVTLFLLMLMLGCWFVKMVLEQRSFAMIRPAPPNIFMLLFALTVVISYVWSSLYVDPNVSYFQNQKFLPRTLTGIVLIVSPLVALYYGNILKSVRMIKLIVWFFIIVGSLFGFAWLLNIKLPAFLNYAGQMGAWTSVLALGQVFFNRSLRWWQVAFLLASVSAWGYIVIGLGMDWLSGWVPLAMGLLILVLLRSRRLFMLAMVGVAIFAYVERERLIDMFLEEQEISGDTRLGAAQTVMEIASEHFLFGTGPAGYYFYMTVNVGGLFQLSHNNFFDIYAQMGILGIATWLALWLSIGWVVWRVFRFHIQDRFLRGLVASLLAIYPMILLLMMLGDWVTPFPYTQTLRGIAYTIWPWMWVGIALALYHMQPAGLLPSTDEPVSDEQGVIQ